MTFLLKSQKMAESISSPSSLKKALSWDNKTLDSNDPLLAEILGMDEFSYFHIRICDNKVSELYQCLRTAAQNAVNGKKCMTKKELEVGSPCIVEYCKSRARGNYFCRGKILEVFPNEEISNVRCFLIDDFLEVKVPQTQIFNTNSDIQRLPTFALKCQLDEMECFMGQHLLKTFYDEFMKGEEKPGPYYCTVKIIRWTWNIPIVQLITEDGTNLAHLFQEFLPISTRLHYPQPENPLPVKVVHFNKEGKIYFRLEKDNELYKIVKSRLAEFQRGKINVDTRAPFFDYGSDESWRDEFLDGPESIFILKERTTSYRVKILMRNKDRTVRVTFVDFGWTDDVPEKNLTPAYQVDQNLCYIEPQCLSAKLWKTDQCNFENSCDRKILWGFVKRKPVYLVLKDYGSGKLTDRFKGKILPNVDLLIRSKRTHPDHLGHSLVETLEIFHPNFVSSSHSSKETQLPDSDSGQPLSTMDQATDVGTTYVCGVTAIESDIISNDSNMTNEAEDSKLKSDNFMDFFIDCLKQKVIV